jgi:membrane protein
MIHWTLHTFWPRLRRSVDNWFEDYGGMMAAATAYYAALSIFPILLLLIAILGFVVEFSATVQGAKAQLLRVVADNTSPQLSDHVADALAGVETSAAIGGPMGVLILVVTAIAVFSQVDMAMDRIFGVKAPKPGVVATVKRLLFQRLRAFGMLCVLGLVVIAMFFASMTLSAVRKYADTLPGSDLTWLVAQAVTSVVMYWLVFTTLYWALPKVPVRWREATGGGAIAAVLWEISRQILTAFVVGERYSAYGVVGSLIILMLWIYFGACIVYFGAEYVQVVCEECGRSRRRVKGEE